MGAGGCGAAERQAFTDDAVMRATGYVIKPRSARS